MAFDDLPKIDRPAVNSDQSTNALRNVLNPASGFVLRPDVPDLGCDFDVELIGEKENASNSRFPIQLKSVEETTVIQDGRFISYSFKTSRLGYLIRRI